MKNTEINEVDEDLIREARHMSPSCWVDIDALIDKAPNSRTRAELQRIQIRKYHEEEYSAGCL